MALVMLVQSAGADLPAWLTEDWVKTGVAAVTPFLVWLWPNKEVNQRNRIRSPALVGVVALLLASLAIGACSGTREAYRTAEGLDETAKVVAEHYFAIVRELNRLDDAGRLTPAQLSHAQDLVRSTQPLIQELGSVSRAYQNVQSAENELQLETAINDAAIAVSRLVDVLKRAGGSSSDLRRIEREVDQLLTDQVERALKRAA